MTQTIKSIIEIITIVMALIPLIVNVVRLVAQKTHNQRLENLSARAMVIVQAMEQSGLSNEEKKDAALEKLGTYATEVGIPINGDQLEDYIESAVNFLKALPGGEQHAKKEIDKTS